ncbi:hypothetical protein [Paenibacillus sp. Soil522]|uniref:hypothetical protein n=1 Tax=Paenibacillus sp. Soil522 TaxID=1736388 RepID=UPI000A5E7577|nr:hypothetical protein [Paenibacillus sp. Soil522]
MAAQYAFLALWLVGLFGIIGIVINAVTRFVNQDSQSHDEQFVWRRRLPPEAVKRK